MNFIEHEELLHALHLSFSPPNILHKARKHVDGPVQPVNALKDSENVGHTDLHTKVHSHGYNQWSHNSVYCVVEDMATPALEFSRISHTLFHRPPFMNSPNENVLPRVKFHCLNILKRHVQLVASLITNFVFIAPG